MGIGGISFWQVLIILVLLLVLFGGKKIRSMGSDLGEGLKGFKKAIKDTILVFPSGIGSSVGAYTIYSIKSNNVAPLAMICKKADLTVATGCALANIPLITISDDEFLSIKNGIKISLDTDSSILSVHQ